MYLVYAWYRYIFGPASLHDLIQDAKSRAGHATSPAQQRYVTISNVSSKRVICKSFKWGLVDPSNPGGIGSAGPGIGDDNQGHGKPYLRKLGEEGRVGISDTILSVKSRGEEDEKLFSKNVNNQALANIP